jgi:all-trans-retinol 13,14-reductase
VACGIVAKGGRVIRAKAVLSNANIKNTVFRLAGAENFSPEYAAAAQAVRINSSSCQVYLGIRKGESIPHIGDLVFTSASPTFSSSELTDLHTTSRTFSVYYPDTRPGLGPLHGRRLDQRPLRRLEQSHGGGLREGEGAPDRGGDRRPRAVHPGRPGEKIDWKEAATPRTIERYTTHFGGTSFGTKFEGLKVSMDLSEQLPGLYHAGSVGIIMSGWLGTINYGVITANKVDRYVCAQRQGRAA